MKIVNISPDSMKLVGRTYIAENRLYPIHSGSGCEFHFTGTKLEIILSCSDRENSGIPYCNRPRIAVTVNGRFVIKKVIEYCTHYKSSNPKEIKKMLYTPIEHDISIIK